MRKLLMAGNWKMNKKPSETAEFFNDYANHMKLDLDQVTSHVDVLFAVPFTTLTTALEITKTRGIQLAAQNVHYELEGAFTGEISVPMIKDLGIDTTLVGHSERRQYFNETDEIVAKKTKRCLDLAVTPIVCVGETKEEREQSQTEQVIEKQMAAIFQVVEQWRGLVIAYEPVWAIGTGLTATPEQAQDAHRFIRSLIAKRYGNKSAMETRILYGGSMKASNAESLLTQEDIDGGLVGGASLKPEEFAQMTRTALQIAQS